MHRIDTPTAQADKWGAGKNGWTNGDLATGVKATAFNASFCDSIQEEICNAIEKSGIPLDPADNTQLWKAISKGFGKYLAIANNLSEIADAGAEAQGEARDNIGLGNAAQRNVTTSNSDTSPGHLVQTGDYGWGAPLGGGVALTSIFDVKCSRVYNAFGINNDNATTGMPDDSGDEIYSAVVINTYSDRYYIQLNGVEKSYVGVIYLKDLTVEWATLFTTKNPPDLSKYETIENAKSTFQLKNTASLGMNMWFKDSSTGMIIQSMRSSVGGATTVNYPIAFPQSEIGVFSGTISEVDNAYYICDINGMSVSDFSVSVLAGQNGQAPTSIGSSTVTVSFFAIGYANPVTENPGLLKNNLLSEMYYSANTNAFYPSELYYDYITAGTWPDDALAVDYSVYQEFAANQPPNGKKRVAGSDGMPAWGDIPSPSPGMNLLNNSATREQMIQRAMAIIITLQAGVSLNRNEEGDANLLAEWQNYLCDLRALTPEQLQQSSVAFPPSSVSIF